MLGDLTYLDVPYARRGELLASARQPPVTSMGVVRMFRARLAVVVTAVVTFVLLVVDPAIAMVR